jgi:hypothetical protein
MPTISKFQNKKNFFKKIQFSFSLKKQNQKHRFFWAGKEARDASKVVVYIKFFRLWGFSGNNFEAKKELFF